MFPRINTRGSLRLQFLAFAHCLFDSLLSLTRGPLPRRTLASREFCPSSSANACPFRPLTCYPSMREPVYNKYT